MRNAEFKYLEDADYKRIYKELETFCINETQPLFIGEFGDSSFPSISDLDVFICLKDHEFTKQKNRIITFIDSHVDRQYIFFHDPLILPESLLPFFKEFHTAYNLKITFQKNSSKLITKISDKQIDFLNVIWTTFLMNTATDILVASDVSSRTKLLILKNICQSISNIDKNNEALSFSDELRKNVFEQKVKDQDINKAFSDKLNELFHKANNLEIVKDPIPIKKSKFRVGFNKNIELDSLNSFSIIGDEIKIKLNPHFFNLFTQFYYKKSNDKIVQRYIDNSAKVWKFSKKIKLQYPFIIPFGYQFYRTDLKYIMKKTIFSIMS